MVDIAMIKADVWDDRKCELGEGPASAGKNNQRGYWVDITGKKVLWRDLDTNATGEYSVDEEIGFVIPRAQGGELIGTTSGPYLRDADGTMHALPNRIDVDGPGEKFPIRWNDAKVSPTGDLWLGSLTADFTPGEAALYRLDRDGSKMERVISDVTLSNGLDWSNDGKTMYYIDTMKFTIDSFDVEGKNIKNRKVRYTANPDEGFPDGMCADNQGGLWVAFWGSSEVRRLDENFKVSEIISVPAMFASSCAFIGPDLDILMITTAQCSGRAGDPFDDGEHAGKTFICKPGATGRATASFAV